MARKTFEFSEQALSAMHTLAEITGVAGERELARLLQDAIRTYEWVLRQQVMGHRVGALPLQDVPLLAESPAIPGGREWLALYIAPGQQQRATQYFRSSCYNAASERGSTAR